VCETPIGIARVIPCPVHYLFNAMGNLGQSVVGVIRLHSIINCLYENKCTIPCTVLLVPKKGGLVKVKKEIKSDLHLPDFYTTDQLLDAANQLVKLEADLREFKSFVMGELQRHQRKVGDLLGSPPAI